VDVCICVWVCVGVWVGGGEGVALTMGGGGTCNTQFTRSGYCTYTGPV